VCKGGMGDGNGWKHMTWRLSFTGCVCGCANIAQRKMRRVGGWTWKMRHGDEIRWLTNAAIGLRNPRRSLPSRRDRRDKQASCSYTVRASGQAGMRTGA